MNIKELLKQIIQAYDSTIDVSDSSVEADLLLNPAAALLDPFVAQLQFLLNNLGLKTPEAITEEELDAIISNYLIFRNSGGKVTGAVEFFYDEPISLSIPSGSTVSTRTGETFKVIQSYYISETTMAANTWNFPLYSTGPITVQAEGSEAKYSIPAGAIVSTTITPAPVQVTNSASFGQGTPKETNTEVVDRLLSSIVSKSYASAASIDASLNADYPSISKVVVRGMNDLEMLRDVIYSGINAYENRITIDYYGKVPSGIVTLSWPYPESKVYYQLFYDDPTTSGIVPDLPQMEEFIFELDDYKGIFKLNNGLTTVFDKSSLLNESFNETTLPTRWVASDAALSAGILRTSNEVVIDNGRLRLGYTRTGDNVEESEISITPQFIYYILNSIKQINRMGTVSASSTQRDIDSYTDLQQLWQ
jgi:hypothetical protein